MKIDKQLEHYISHEDLEKCFEFTLEYHLTSKKGSISRTTGQYRGLGGIIDSFFIGKIIEIGVASIIEQFTDKKVMLDFDIHPVTDDPDIISIKENTKKRDPKLFVEIKYSSENDRWIGLTTEQFDTILKKEIVESNPDNLFIIGASLISKEKNKDIDLLGVFLKSKFDKELMKKFVDPKDLFVRIQYVLSGDELKKKGVPFNKGSYLYETDIFDEVTSLTFNQIINRTNNETFKIVKTKNNIFPIIMRDRAPNPDEFGEFYYKGDLEVYKKSNVMSDRSYVYCKSDVVIENKVLGKFELNKGEIYECWFETIGRDPVLKRNNIWIAYRNLPNIISNKLSDRIKFIAHNI